jgi:hypothetical protein
MMQNSMNIAKSQWDKTKVKNNVCALAYFKFEVVIYCVSIGKQVTDFDHTCWQGIQCIGQRRRVSVGVWCRKVHESAQQGEEGGAGGLASGQFQLGVLRKRLL